MTTIAPACWPTPGSSATGPRSTPRSATRRAAWRSAAEFGGFDAYLRSIVTEPAGGLPPGSLAGQIPASTPASVALSKDLQARGFRFVGPTITYAFMQSVGLVDDHLPGCFRYRG